MFEPGPARLTRDEQRAREGYGEIGRVDRRMRRLAASLVAG